MLDVCRNMVNFRVHDINPEVQSVEQTLPITLDPPHIVRECWYINRPEVALCKFPRVDKSCLNIVAVTSFNGTFSLTVPTMDYPFAFPRLVALNTPLTRQFFDPLPRCSTPVATLTRQSCNPFLP